MASVMQGDRAYSIDHTMQPMDPVGFQKDLKVILEKLYHCLEWVDGKSLRLHGYYWTFPCVLIVI